MRARWVRPPSAQLSPAPAAELPQLPRGPYLLVLSASCVPAPLVLAQGDLSHACCGRPTHACS